MAPTDEGPADDVPRRLVADDVRVVAFTPTRLRGGYDTGEIDAFLRRVEEDLRRRDRRHPPQVTAEEVRTIRFTPVRFREGYDMREVDAFLDDVEGELTRRDGDDPGGRHRAG